MTVSTDDPLPVTMGDAVTVNMPGTIAVQVVGPDPLPVTVPTPLLVIHDGALPIQSPEPLPVNINGDDTRFLRYQLNAWYNITNTNENVLPLVRSGGSSSPIPYVAWTIDGVVENLPADARLTVRIKGRRQLFGSVYTPWRTHIEIEWAGEPLTFEARHYDGIIVTIQATNYTTSPQTRAAFVLIGSPIPYNEL